MPRSCIAGSGKRIEIRPQWSKYKPKKPCTRRTHKKPVLSICISMPFKPVLILWSVMLRLSSQMAVYTSHTIAIATCGAHPWEWPSKISQEHHGHGPNCSTLPQPSPCYDVRTEVCEQKLHGCLACGKLQYHHRWAKRIKKTQIAKAICPMNFRMIPF